MENQQKIEELSQKIEEMRRLIIDKDAKSYLYFDTEIDKRVEAKVRENLNSINRQIRYLERGMGILLPIIKVIVKVRKIKKCLCR